MPSLIMEMDEAALATFDSHRRSTAGAPLLGRSYFDRIPYSEWTTAIRFRGSADIARRAAERSQNPIHRRSAATAAVRSFAVSPTRADALLVHVPSRHPAGQLLRSPNSEPRPEEAVYGIRKMPTVRVPIPSRARKEAVCGIRSILLVR